MHVSFDLDFSESRSTGGAKATAVSELNALLADLDRALELELELADNLAVVRKLHAMKRRLVEVKEKSMLEACPVLH